MMQISLSVNGERTEAVVEPRLHLADFLREHCNLTGTHLGCEHGVCGACTVLLDGAPIRSCLTRAVACGGTEVRTVEGFPDDLVMVRLREAFKREHALQCGFCTPGMLIAAYDLVRRLPGASEARIRSELAGNLCRCTGYMGIVAAIKRVMGELASSVDAVEPMEIRPVSTAAQLPLFTPMASEAIDMAVSPIALRAEPERPSKDGWTRVAESFTVAHPPRAIWTLLCDVPRMAACMPGATLTDYKNNTLRGSIKVRLGPIQACFVGSALLERDDRQMMGRMSGGGDEKDASRAEGTIVYSLHPQSGGKATLVAVEIDYRIQGVLAQFGRSSVVRDLIRRMAMQFAQNVAALADGAEPAAERPEIDAGRLLSATILYRIREWLNVILGSRRE